MYYAIPEVCSLVEPDYAPAEPKSAASALTRRHVCNLGRAPDGELLWSVFPLLVEMSKKNARVLGGGWERRMHEGVREGAASGRES